MCVFKKKEGCGHKSSRLRLNHVLRRKVPPSLLTSSGKMAAPRAVGHRGAWNPPTVVHFAVPLEPAGAKRVWPGLALGTPVGLSGATESLGLRWAEAW